MKTLTVLLAVCFSAIAQPGVVTYPAPGATIVQSSSVLTIQWGALAAPYHNFSYCVSTYNPSCYTLDAEGNGTSYESGSPQQSASTTGSSVAINFSFIPANTQKTVYLEIEGSPTGWDGTSYHNVMLTRMTFQFIWTNSGVQIAQMYSPQPGSMLNAGNGSSLQINFSQPSYWPIYIWIGTQGVGSGNIYGQGTAVYQAPSQTFSIPTASQCGCATLYIRLWSWNGSAYDTLDYVLYPYGMAAGGSNAMAPGVQDPGFDDTTGGTTTMPDPFHPLPAMLHVKLPTRGVTVSFPSAAGGMPLSAFAWKTTAEGGQTRYTYTLDNAAVWMFRISDDPKAMNSVTDWNAPKGWAGYGAAFGAVLPESVRSKEAEYTFLSPYRPGLVAVYFQNENGANGVPYEPDSRDGAALAERGHILANSAVKWAIGPAFPPEATKKTVQALVRHWVEDLGFTALQPYLDTGRLDAVQPSNQLERDVLDCLRAVL